MTAVEYLIKQITDLRNGRSYGANIEEAFKYALEMEKQQIIDAYETNRDIDTIQTAESYYDETYKKYF